MPATAPNHIGMTWLLIPEEKREKPPIFHQNFVSLKP